MKHADNEALPLWCFVPLNDYKKPPEPASEKMRRGLLGLWDRLFSKESPHVPGGDEELNRRDGDLLQGLLASPDWQQAVPALDEVLHGWVENGERNTPLMALLNPPYSGVRQIASLWAAQRHWRVMEPPGPGELLSGEAQWIRNLDSSDESPWLIPALEGWYLRHFNALGVVREFLEVLLSRRQLTLICCDSWAWAYLDRTVHLARGLPSPLIPAAFDGERLNQWFPALTRLEGDGHCAFREEKSEKFVLCPEEDGGEEHQREMSNFLDRLAAYGRGIPGVAWALWHCTLCSARMEDQERAEGIHKDSTIWLKPWQELDLPAVPQHNRDELAFVLHTLLLHNGVETELLPELLPGMGRQILPVLHDLEAARVVEQQQRVWRVTALGYPAVRAFLKDEGYLVDAV